VAHDENKRSKNVTFIIASEAGESFAKLVFNIIVSLAIPRKLLSG